MNMKLEQAVWQRDISWNYAVGDGTLGKSAQLVLVFGAKSALEEKSLFSDIAKRYPAAHVFGCSTSGEICGTAVTDDSVVATAVAFEHSRIEGASIDLDSPESSYEAGRKLARLLNKPDLVHIFVLSEGLCVNGSDLVNGLMEELPQGITASGGLAGDGGRFKETYAFWDAKPSKNKIAAIGLYGNRLKVGYGSLGGWDPFGPERLITRSKRNVLFELDGRSALELYKRYLGEHAGGLPATGLLFPLSIRSKEGDVPLVRTVLSIDEKEQSMTFAGDIPEGAYARLMKANFDRLIDGAMGAAKTSLTALHSLQPQLAVLISCVGRKMILKQRTEEEVEGVRDILGDNTVLAGFYSYGEISPFCPSARCELHNQTMTITVFSES